VPAIVANTMPGGGTTLDGRMPRPAEILASDHRWLRRLARRLARSSGSADDLAQDTCVTALGKPAPDGEMRPWLRAIMRNLAWGEVRGGVRRFQREDRYQRGEPPAAEPDPLLAYGVDRARLGSCVERLPEPFRSTVLHRFVDGLSCAEIARAEGVPAGTVRWRQSRALELLRADLERPAGPPGRRLLWLPALGLERAIAVARRLAGLPRTVWLGLALVGVIVAIAISGRDADRSSGATGRVRATALGSGGLLFDRRVGVDLVRIGTDPQGGFVSTAGGGPAVDQPAANQIAGDGPADATALDGPSLTALREAYERALYDCRIERGVLRCTRTSVDARRRGGAICLVLDRSLGALGRARRGEVPVERPLRLSFLDAAALANQSLAAVLGCALAPDHEVEPADDRLRGGVAGPEPSCTREERDDGKSCARCTDAEGRTSTACAPVDCETTTGVDGQVCTTCTDAGGVIRSECDESQSADCDSEVGEYGVVCSSCPAGSAAAPECLVAACQPVDGCLECTDGRGRVARDCATSLASDGTAVAGWSGGDVLRFTSAWWGESGGAGSAVHYAGTSTCSASGCLDCRFADGSASGRCPYDGDLEDDLWEGRPEDLPAPGRCVTARHGHGVDCTTCTRQDLSASVLCRFPPAVSCDQPIGGCVTCALIGGGTASSCDASGS